MDVSVRSETRVLRLSQHAHQGAESQGGLLVFQGLYVYPKRALHEHVTLREVDVRDICMRVDLVTQERRRVGSSTKCSILDNQLDKDKFLTDITTCLGLRPTNKTSTSKKKAATTLTATTPLSTTCHKTNWQTSWSYASTAQCEQPTDDMLTTHGITSWILRQSRSSRLKQPTRLTTSITTTTTTKSTTVGQTSHATETHDHDEGGPDHDEGAPDDDTRLILSQLVES